MGQSGCPEAQNGSQQGPSQIQKVFLYLEGRSGATSGIFCGPKMAPKGAPKASARVKPVPIPPLAGQDARFFNSSMPGASSTTASLTRTQAHNGSVRVKKNIYIERER